MEIAKLSNFSGFAFGEKKNLLILKGVEQIGVKYELITHFSRVYRIDSHWQQCHSVNDNVRKSLRERQSFLKTLPNSVFKLSNGDGEVI